MRRRSFLGICAGSSLIGVFGVVPAAVAKPKKHGSDGGNNDPNGWLWSYSATKGESVESGTFRVSNLEVFKSEKKVGHIEPEGGKGLGDKTVLILTDFGDLSGTVVLEKVHMKPPAWAGTLKKDDGTEWHFKVKLIEK